MRLSTLGVVETLDYPYMLEKRRAPDKREVLVKAHLLALEKARAAHPSLRTALVGKSMGGRIGCHAALEAQPKPDALVCLGYPLAGRGPEREGVLLEVETPILFVQGTRDQLCPLERLNDVRGRMRAPNELHLVHEGDHSLKVTRRALAERGETDESVTAGIDRAIRSFLERYC
jgi:predicted alpha/beta-hydrolase family hydrolase